MVSVKEYVTAEQLAAVASMAPTGDGSPDQTRPSVGNSGFSHRLNVGRWLSDRGVEFKVKQAKGRTVYLITCPFNPEHNGTDTAIMQCDDGKMQFNCYHNSCDSHGWQEVKEKLGKPDPDHYDPPLTGPTAMAAPAASVTAAPATTIITSEPRRTIDLIDSPTFAVADYRQRYLVKGVLVADQPCMWGGKSKTLKTSMLVDLALSLGTGMPFLGKFTTRQTTAAILSGESGQFVIQETARRVALAKDVELASATIHWGFDLPQIARLEDLDALTEAIQRTESEVVCLDPAYLCLLGGDARKRQASNLFDTGPLLLQLTKIGEKTGATIILCHHCRKNMADPYEPPGLEDLSMAGFAEWARQWVLWGRRASYEQGSGFHELWMNIGGSAGHSGCWGVDVNEGVPGEDFGGRFWDVSVQAMADARQDVHQREESRRQANWETKEKAAIAIAKQAILQAFNSLDGHRGSKSKISEFAGKKGKAFDEALGQLLRAGDVRECTFKHGNGKSCDGFERVFKDSEHHEDETTKDE